MGAMTLSATREWDFSSEQGKANYKAAQRRYPAQAIVDLAALRDNMRHLVSVVGGPHSGTAVMGIVKADAYGNGRMPAALAALTFTALLFGSARRSGCLLVRLLCADARLFRLDLGKQRIERRRRLRRRRNTRHGLPLQHRPSKRT